MFLYIISEFGSCEQTWKKYPFSKPGSQIEFPRDEGFHPDESLEWWYVNGHLKGQTSGNSYSFMLSYFHRPLLIFDGFRILSVTNETTGVTYSQTLPCTYPILAVDSLHIQASFITANPAEEWVNSVDFAGSMIPFQYRINASAGNTSVDFTLDAEKPPLIIDDDGFLYQGSGNYTYYYSLTDMNTTGTISFNGVHESVTGIAWIDRQYGNFDPYQDEDYEWQSIQLSNNMDLNIWNIFNSDNSIPKTKDYRICSVLVNDTVSMTTQNFEIRRLSYNYTADSQKCYASSWEITSDTLGVNLIVKVNDKNQEIAVNEIGLRFYEGSTNVTGYIKNEQVTGAGFAELLHSYEKPVLKINQPLSGQLWNTRVPLSWNVSNPDEGNPILYEIQVGYDADKYVKVLSGINDTFFYWNPSVFSGNTDFYVRILGYSIDSTLTSMATEHYTYEPVNTEYSGCLGQDINLSLELDSNYYHYQWLFYGQSLGYPDVSYLSLPQLTDESSGLYSCIVFNDIFADTTLEFRLITGTCNQAIDHLQDETVIFPNPFNETITVQLPEINESGVLSIKNIFGTIIYETNIPDNQNEIIIPIIQPGIYFLELIYQNNYNIGPFRLVKL